MPAAIAFRYARAFAGLLAQAGQPAEAALAEIALFERTLKESQPLHVALESPAVPPAIPVPRVVWTSEANRRVEADLALR